MDTLATAILIIAVIFLAGSCVAALWVLYQELMEIEEEDAGLIEEDEEIMPLHDLIEAAKRDKFDKEDG